MKTKVNRKNLNMNETDDIENDNVQKLKQMVQLKFKFNIFVGFFFFMDSINSECNRS